MGSELFFNAARMQAIENGTVTSGLVDTAGRLILKKRDGGVIDAGSVVGPAGFGTPADLANTLQSAKDFATSADAVVTSSVRAYSGVVDSSYTSGLVPVAVSGFGIVSASFLRNMPPRAGATVLLERLDNSWVIIDEVVTQPDYNQWIPLELQNGWKVYNPNYPDFGIPAVTKSPMGWVVLRGMIASGTNVAGTLLFVLPANLRPTHGFSIFPAITNGTVARVDVNTNGNVVLANPGGNAWLSLENIRFHIGTRSSVLAMSAYLNGWRNLGGINPPGEIWIDQENFVATRGVVSSGTGTDGTPLITLNNTVYSELTSKYTHHAVATAGGMGGISMGPTNLQVKFPTSNQFLSLDGANWDRLKPNTRWTPVSFENGWQNYDANTYPAAGFYKRSDGLVALKGLIGAGTMNTYVFRLPPGLRPKHKILRLVMTGAADRLGRVDIGADGGVLVVAGSNVWVSLDGILFSPEG